MLNYDSIDGGWFVLAFRRRRRMMAVNRVRHATTIVAIWHFWVFA